jgi:hypothetical protein
MLLLLILQEMLSNLTYGDATEQLVQLTTNFSNPHRQLQL